MKEIAFTYILKMILDQTLLLTTSQGDNQTPPGTDLALSPADKATLLANIMEAFDCSKEKAVLKLRAEIHEVLQSRRARIGRNLAAVLLWLVLLYVVMSSRLGAASPFVYLAIALLVFCLFLFGARRRALKKILKNRRDQGIDLQQVIEEMLTAYFRSQFSLANKPVLIVLLACVLATGAYAIVPGLLEPAYIRISQQLQAGMNHIEYDQLLSRLKKLDAERAGNTLAQTGEQLSSQEDDFLLLAGLANDLAKAGTISRNTSAEYVNRVLREINVYEIDSDSEISLLKDFLDCASPSAIDSFAGRFAATTLKHEAICRMLGAYYASQRSTRELVELAEDMGDVTFLQGALEEEELSIALQRMDDLSSHPHHVLLARTLGERIQQPDDVLSFLQRMQLYDVQPSECYPNGAVLDWDMSWISDVTMIEEWVDCGRWLPVRVTEGKEKLEYREVPKALQATGSSFESVYDSSYESNDALGKDAFEVVLDTEWMERIPEENLPETIDQLDSLLVMGTLYMREGTLRNTSYTSESAFPTESPFLSHSLNRPSVPLDATINWQRDYPTYFAYQSVEVFDLKSGLVNYWFRRNVIESPEVPSRSSFFSELTSSDIEHCYTASPDEAWAVQAREEVFALLEETGWNLNMAIFTDAMSVSEE